MKIIGLTGQSGAGKGTVAKILAENGIPHIDCDKIYHSMLKADGECTKALTERFGEEILSSDGSVNRKKLAEIVFSGEDREKDINDLNAITHSTVLKKCRELLVEYKDQGKIAAVVDAPMLFESGFDNECDIVLSVIAPIEIRLKRIIKRDGISKEKALARFSAQKSEEFFIKSSDHIIENSSNEEDLRNAVLKFIGEKLS